VWLRRLHLSMATMPSLFPLVKVQDMVVNGDLTLHQFHDANQATDGRLALMLVGCADAYNKYRQHEANWAEDAICAGLHVCKPEVVSFLKCIKKISAAQQRQQHHAQFAGPPPPPLPTCGRIKQDLEKCATRFSSTVVDQALENAV
jgi:hypothetical protein